MFRYLQRNYSVSDENKMTLTESQRHRENQIFLTHLCVSVRKKSGNQDGKKRVHFLILHHGWLFLELAVSADRQVEYLPCSSKPV